MNGRLYSEQQVSAAVEKVISDMLARGALIRPGDLPQRTPQHVLVSREDLDDMLASWEDAANYKGDYLREKHGDTEEIAKYRERYASTRPEHEGDEHG